MTLIPALAAALLLGATALQAAEIGLRQITIDPDSSRPLDLTIWYPTDDSGPLETLGGNAAFYGVQVHPDAQPQAGRHPVILLSHGYGGNWRNLNWLAGRLVPEGYVVAAPDHPGTTTFDRSPEQASRLWERPRDLSRSLDAMLATPEFDDLLDPARVTAIGHSLGGWTVAALAGARFDPVLFAQDCDTNPTLRTCELSEELGLGDSRLGQDLHDPRLAAFVTLDLGLARGFSADSLAQVDIPALVLGADIDIGGLPAALESGWLAAHLPARSTQEETIPGTMHFSFIQRCKPGAEALLDAETPGDGIICHDGYDRDRSALHDEIARRISGFLSQSLPPRQAPD